MAEEQNRIGARSRRYAKVAAGLGGTAVKYGAGRLLGRDQDARALAGDFVKVLGGLKGPVMKTAQFMATIPGFLPDDAAEELRSLQSDAPAMGWPFVRRRMAGELGSDWQSQFQSFERDASAAASLGQVHRATDMDGRDLACKLQYPEMASAIEADLRQLRFGMNLFGQRGAALDPSEMIEEISERLREELDYGRELRHILLYRDMLAEEKHISIPAPVPALSTGRLLTMTWLTGEPILNFVDESLDVRNAIATQMFKAWWMPFVQYGVIHGDPHLGNYSVRRGADLEEEADITFNLLDFGCVRIFPPSFVDGVVSLYLALRDDDLEAAKAAYGLWGFRDVTTELADALNIWANFILGPLMDDRVRSIADGTSPGLYGRAEAEKMIVALKSAGAVTLPREFVLMDRAAVGLGSVFMHLNAELNWYELFAEAIKTFDVGALTDRQQEALAAAEL